MNMLSKISAFIFNPLSAVIITDSITGGGWYVMPKDEKEMFSIGAKVITVEYEHTGELGKTPSQLSGARLIKFLYYSPQ